MICRKRSRTLEAARTGGFTETVVICIGQGSRPGDWINFDRITQHGTRLPLSFKWLTRACLNLSVGFLVWFIMYCHALSQDGGFKQMDKSVIDVAYKAWSKYETLFFSRVSGEFIATTHLDGARDHVQRGRCAFHGKNRLIEADMSNPFNPNQGVSCRCVNNRYAFEVSLASTGTWVLRQLQDTGAYEQRCEALELTTDSIWLELVSPVATPFISLRQLVKDPSFEVNSVVELANGNVVLSFKLGSEKGRARLLKSGSLTLDPANLWVPLSYELNADYSDFGRTVRTIIIGQCSYIETGVPGFQLPRLMKSTTRNQDGHRLLSSSTEYQLSYNSRDVRTERFYLTAFNLPEPTLPNKAGPVWTFAIVALIFAGAVGLWLLRGSPFRNAKRVRAGRSAFALIELLVVLAIIGVLMGLALPAV